MTLTRVDPLSYSYIIYIYIPRIFQLFFCFMFFQFDILKEIGGTKNKANGNDVLHSIFDHVFENEFLSKITWTGRGGNKGGGGKKIPMKQYTGVVELIKDLCSKAGEGYTKEQCQSDIIYSVLKYAYQKAPDFDLGNKRDKQSDDSNSSVSSPAPSVDSDRSSSESNNSQASQNGIVHVQNTIQNVAPHSAIHEMNNGVHVQTINHNVAGRVDASSQNIPMQTFAQSSAIQIQPYQGVPYQHQKATHDIQYAYRYGPYQPPYGL